MVSRAIMVRLKIVTCNLLLCCYSGNHSIMLQASQDQSSSFPSATVSCALVYLYMFCEIWAAIILNNAHQLLDDNSTALSLFIYLPMFILAVGIIVLVSCVKVIA